MQAEISDGPPRFNLFPRANQTTSWIIRRRPWTFPTKICCWYEWINWSNTTHLWRSSVEWAILMSEMFSSISSYRDGTVDVSASSSQTATVLVCCYSKVKTMLLGQPPVVGHFIVETINVWPVFVALEPFLTKFFPHWGSATAIPSVINTNNYSTQTSYNTVQHSNRKEGELGTL